MLWYDDVKPNEVDRTKIRWYSTKLKAPIKAGDPLGVVTLVYNGEELKDVEIVAVSDVNRSMLKYNLYAAKMFPKAAWFKKALFISIMVCVIYILVCIYAYVMHKNKNKPIKPKYAVPKVRSQKKRK